MTEAPRSDHFPLFDALRGLAAIAVVTYHGVYLPALYNGIGGGGWGWIWRYVMHLDVAVPIFLGISGFLLYRPFVAARHAGRPVPALGRYGLRRLLRIVPGYWFALTVLTLWFWWQPPGFSEVRADPLPFYGFAQIYSARTAIAGIGQAWTLGVEVVFYLALPLWVLLMRRLKPSLRSELIGIAVLIALSIAWKVFALSQTDPATRASLPWLLPMPTWLDHLALGMLLAVLSVWRPHLRAIGDHPARMWALALAFWLGACWLAGPDGSVYDRLTDRIYLERHLFYGAFVFCLLAPAVFGNPAEGRIRALLRWRPLAYVGAISFSFYLFHYDVLHQMQHTWGHAPETGWQLVPWWIVAVAGSVVLGTIGYRLVELPFMALGKRRREPAVAAARRW
jgi:peptidoglycan/LPS O-acetylase OafA/YrhL